MSRRINTLKISILLVVLAMVAVACGDGSDAAGGGDDGGEVSYPESVTIGTLFPMTGEGASYGDWFSRGAEMAAEHINENGGIGGQTTVEIDIEDHQADAGTALTLFRQFVDEGVPYVLSSYTPPTLTILPAAEESGTMVVNGGGQGSELGGASDYLLNTIPLLEDENVVLADYLIDEGFETATIIYVDDDSGETARDDFTEAFEDAGGEVVATAGHEFGASDIRPQLTQLRAENADVLYIGSHGQDAVNIIEQAREVGVEAQLANTSWVILPEVTESPAAQGLIHSLLTFDAPEFEEEYRERFGDDPSIYVVNYYDAVTVFAEAFEHAVENGYGTDGDAIRQAIFEIGEFEGLGGSLVFREDGTVVKPIAIAEIRDNESVIIEEAEADPEE